MLALLHTKLNKIAENTIELIAIKDFIMQYELPIYVIIFLYGIVIGSFLNVLIYRLPLKENIATENSHCMSCGHRLQWYDLVPLVSYMILGGKCRYCKTKISPQYPIIEAANGVMYVIIFAVNGLNIISGLMCLVFSMFLVISVIDERTQEIPFALNIVIGVLGIIRILFDREHLLDYLIGFFCISGFMLLLLIIGRAVKGVDAFGGGDIKLMAAAGLFLGYKNVILAFFLGCILGAVIHVIRMKVSGKQRVLAFGPYLCAGLTIAMLFGTNIINWYLSLMAF